MSRSFKKISIIGDVSIRRNNPSLSEKRMHHGKVRTAVRTRLANQDYEDLIFPTSRGVEITNPYDIRDWYYFPDKNEKWYAKGKRK